MPLPPAPPPAAPVGAEELARRLQLVTQAAGIGYWSLQGDAERAWWSEGLRALHCLTPDDPVPTFGDWLRHWVHPEQQQRCFDTWVQWLASPLAPLDEELQLRGPDGRWRDIAIHSMVERQGADRLLLGVLVDVTAQREAERSLRQAMARESLAVRTAGLGIWEVDLASNDAHWTDTMWTLRGLAPQPVPPDHGARMAMVHPDDREAMEKSLVDGDRTNGLRHHEFRIVRPDGEVRWLVSRSMTLRDRHGRPERRVGVNWDITALRQAEVARLEREQALRDSETKTRLLSRMSHELRTPLNAVLGLSQLLLKGEGGEDPPAQLRRQRLGQLKQAGEQLLALVDDVLELSDLQAGIRTLSAEPVPMEPLLRECLASRLQALQAAGRELRPGALEGRALVDRRALVQVLTLLLSQAAEHGRPGAGIAVLSRPVDDRILVQVDAEGDGLDPQQVDRLFEPFGAPGTPAPGAEGRGLGLALAKALVEHMGGQILVRSRRGQGICFELNLPAAPPPVPRSGPAPEHVVLYIEDNAINALIVKELLGMRGDTRTEIAADGSTGLAMARSLRPRVVLLDMQLPDLDGFEVLARLRQDPATAGIPCIALSANALPSDVQRAMAAGMTDYWTKPLDFAAFGKAMERWLGPAPAPAG
jgi:PAS domain S-box-containing protein